MTTFRDHPMSFLCGRQSVGGLVHRAEDWRRRGFTAGDLDVADLFERAARSLTATRNGFVAVRKMLVAEETHDVIGDACRALSVDFDLVEECRSSGQRLRDEGFDPYGGSVAASLEMAAEEIIHLGSCIEQTIRIAEMRGSHASLETVVLDALDIRPDIAEPTHDAPRGLM